MKKKSVPRPRPRNENSYSGTDGKKPWREPKCTFVRPKLTKHGDLKQLTFFAPSIITQ